MKRSRATRSGYALILVLLFMVLFMSILGVAFRRLGTSLRHESVKTFQTKRDSGSVVALARAMSLLETGLPPSSPYVRSTTVITSAGARTFIVTITLEDGTTYSVHVVPAQASESADPLPDTFFAT